MTEQPGNFEQRLSGELKGLFAGPKVGASRDEAILAAARQAGVGSSKAGTRWRWRISAGIGIAAAVAIAAGVLWPRGYERTGDIRDAFYVARQIKAHGGEALDKSKWDVNGDKVVDEKDVQWLALAAVKVNDGKGDVR